MWPTQRTAFLVIHGASAQRPFDTLDRFVRSLRRFFLARPELLEEVGEIAWGHGLRRHGSTDWIESYVSLAPADPSRPPIHVYEYYWDRYMTSSIRLRDMVGWLLTASAGAQEFYDRSGLAARYAQQAPNLFSAEGFRDGGYLRLLGAAGKVLGFRPARALLSLDLLDQIARASLNDWAISFLNDIVVYTTSDVRASSYEIRNKVLAGAAQELSELLGDEAGYEQVVVMSHSLGTQIAYDAVSRIRRDLNVGALGEAQARRLAGLVTCGSPLDKIAFLYSQPGDTSPQNPYVRDQITEQLYGFRRNDVSPPADVPALASPFVRPGLEQLQWLNFYHPQDLFAGPLDVYRVDANLAITDVAADSLDRAHGSYWRSALMFDEIVRAFFG